MSASSPYEKQPETMNSLTDRGDSARAVLEELFSEMADLTEEESAIILEAVLYTKSQRSRVAVSA